MGLYSGTALCPAAYALESAGKPLSALDTMLAAQALAEDLVLVSNDRAFAQVPQLKLEDWTLPVSGQL